MKTYPHRAPAIAVSLAFLLAAALPLAAQLTPQQDPANLAGERVSPPDLADTLPLNNGAPALEQLLRKLRTRASFMLIVAHPDDEDNGMLTYLSRGKGARVATLTLNRGEGGQNLMSADFDDALGLIRTQELLAADRTMAVDQFFGTEVDFGFTKTKEEAFAKWTHDRVLYDTVRAIRLYRPLVIASVFIGEPSDGHGQHQVAGQIAQEAFNAAGDPNVFPDQIAAGLQPWQPLKVYARAPFGRIDAQGMFDSATSQYVPARFTNYVTGKVTDTVPKANVTIPEGDTDPLLGGISYAELGREGRSLHRSQMGGFGGGGGGRGGGGRFDVSYHRYGSKLNQPDGDDSGLESGFYDGIDTSLPGIATLAPEVADKFRPTLEKIDALLAKAQHDFDATKPEAIAPTLHDALAALDHILRDLENPSVNDLPPAESYNLLHELHIKRVQLNNALVLALGVSLTTAVTDADAGQQLFLGNSKIGVDFKISNTASVPLRVSNLQLDTKQLTLVNPQLATLAPHQVTGEHYELQGTQGMPPTRPYFSRPDIEQPFYDISNPSLRNAPAAPAPLVLRATIDDQGVPLELASVVGYPESAGLRQPVVAVPPDSVYFSRAKGIIPLDQKNPMVWAESREPIGKCLSYNNDTPGCNKYADQGSIRLDLPQGWHVTQPVDDVLSPEGDMLRQYDGFTLAPPPIHAGDRLNATAVATWKGKEYREGFRTVGYPGLTTTNYYTPATYSATGVDLRLPPTLVVGYVNGTGDDVSSSLFPVLGGHIQTITVDKLTADNLKRFDAVILGVRAYEHSELATANAALNAYAAAGGIVIAQYNTGRLPQGTGPYPLDLGGSEKVVEEDAPVKIVAPDNPLLNWPNKITTADFAGWVEERGHGFMASWDPHYTPLLETHDAGQPPQLGGLLVARTGRGAWIYLGLAVYRQLPEGVPGAYRLLANLISAGKNPTR